MCQVPETLPGRRGGGAFPVVFQEPGVSQEPVVRNMKFQEPRRSEYE